MKFYKSFLLTCFLFLDVVVMGQQPLAVSTDNRLQTSLDSLVHQALTEFMGDGSRVGLSAGIYTKGNAFTYNYGTTDRNRPQLPSQYTVYEIASLTKTFTATILAHAILEKKIKERDDIRKYLKSSYPNLQYAGQPIRMVHLTNLTSRLPNWLPDDPAPFVNAHPDSMVSILTKIHKSYTRADFYADLHQVRLDTLPGTKPDHSNVAAQLLGYILEDVYRMDFKGLISHFFGSPLQMRRTTILSSVAGEPLLAKGYDDKGRQMGYIDWPDVQEAGGINSNVSDMLKYIRYQLNEKNAAIKLSHQITFGSIANGEAYAFNWRVNKNAIGYRELSHSGGSPGFSSFILLNPDQQTGIILLANQSDAGAQDGLEKAAKKISDGIFRFSSLHH